MSLNKIEKQFTAFVLRTVLGIRCDYHSREQRHREIETEYFSELGNAAREEPQRITLELLLDSCCFPLCARLGLLTEKQTFVLLRLLNGYTEREIAYKMHITQQGVHSIRIRIRNKLEVEK